jgi:Matrixin
MARCGTRRPLAIAIVCAVTMGSIGMASGRADAFDLKRDAHGQSLHWSGSQVTYDVDPSIGEVVRGGAQAVSNAVSVWNGTDGVPALTTVIGTPGATPGLDGKNSILFAPDGFAPAGNALAVTITSYDEATGDIVDADVVINGIHEFAVLPSGARAANDAPRVSTDATSGAAVDAPRTEPFDIIHVVSHEIGHTLGLADERVDDSALMYAFTMPGDASVRAPSADDAAGAHALYGMSARAPVPTSGQGGCVQASIAGARARPEDAWNAFALLSGATMWLASRRRGKAGRLALPVAAALMTLLASPATARSAEDAFDPRSSVTARVLDVSTSNVGGLFETTVELAPTRCADQPCLALPKVHTWGGTVGGITQIVGGGLVPNVGDLVAVTLVKARSPDRRITALVALGTPDGVALVGERH